VADGTYCPLILPGAGAYELVSAEYRAYSDRTRNLSTDAAADIERLTNFTPDFASVNFQVDTGPVADIVVPSLDVDASNRPAYSEPAERFNTAAPTKPVLRPLDDGAGLRALGDAPDPDYGRFVSRSPAPPVLNFPSSPGPAPAIDAGEAPSEPSLVEPDVPSLIDLPDIGEVPPIVLDRVPEIPEFAPPDSALQDIYFQDHDLKRDELDTLIQTFAHTDTGLTELRPAFARVIEAINAENTGLPEHVQQEIFDQGRERLREDQLRSEREAESRWAARGFELPGAALLAAVVEARRTRQVEAGRLNRELTVRVHEQAIENMRYVIDRAVAYEGQLMNIFLQVDNNARQLAFEHYQVMRGIYDAYLAIHELNIRAYQAQIAVYEANVRIELSKLEAYRTELEAIRVRGEINEQEVRIYEAQIRAQAQRVETYQGRVNAYRGKIEAELSKVQAFNATVEAYSAEIRGVAERVNVFEAEVRSEEARTRAHGAQVEAFRARVEAFRSQVDAEATRTRTINDTVTAQAQIYGTEVDAWAAGVQADNQRVERAVSAHRANIDAYLAELNNEETAARLRALGFDKELEQARTILTTQVGNIDRALTNVRTASELELQRLESAARINAQLAAASMAALNLSASLQGSDSFSASSQSNCSTNFSGVI
jgi:hypothetical protein